MHFDVFTSCRQIEAEVIKMTVEAFGDPEAFGCITTGGTESIMLAIYSYKNYAREKRGITKPNM